MRSWTRARLMSGSAWARYWSRRRLAADGSAAKVRMLAVPLGSVSSSSSPKSMTGTGGGSSGSTPRVARYSGLEKKDDACEGDHAEGDPLDRVEGARVGIGLAKEGQEELSSTSSGEGQGEGVAGVATVLELAKQDKGEDGGYDCGVDGDRMEADGVGWDGKAPREGG